MIKNSIDILIDKKKIFMGKSNIDITENILKKLIIQRLDYVKMNKENFKVVTTREPMLLIDELYDIDNLKSATALVNVKKDSFFVQGHFPENPVMPGVLIESLVKLLQHLQRMDLINQLMKIN